MNPAFRNLLLWLALFGLLGYGAVRFVRSTSAPSKAAAASEPTAPAPQAEPSGAESPLAMEVKVEAPPELQAPSPIPADAQGEWPAEWAQWEQEVLELVNARRAEGAVCGGKKMAPASPLVMNDKLRRAARDHSLDMKKHNFTGHESSDGRDLGDRMRAVGYVSRSRGENAARAPEPQRVMQGWMASPPHCKNIMHPEFTEIGVGFVAPYSWTQNFGQGL
jgi:uncharacterized protein YkwD